MCLHTTYTRLKQCFQHHQKSWNIQAGTHFMSTNFPIQIVILQGWCTFLGHYERLNYVHLIMEFQNLTNSSKSREFELSKMVQNILLRQKLSLPAHFLCDVRLSNLWFFKFNLLTFLPVKLVIFGLEIRIVPF